MMPVTIEDMEFKLSPGKHNEVQAAVINEFAPRFAAGAKVLYIGDTANKDLYCNKELLKEIGIPITEHSKLPDIVIYDGNKEWLFLIEVVNFAWAGISQTCNRAGRFHERMQSGESICYCFS